MKVFLAALILIGIGVAGMCFNIIFRNKAFPQTDVGSNDNMKKLGIRCMREEDDERFRKRKAERRTERHVPVRTASRALAAACIRLRKKLTRRAEARLYTKPGIREKQSSRESRYQVLKR